MLYCFSYYFMDRYILCSKMKENLRATEEAENIKLIVDHYIQSNNFDNDPMTTIIEEDNQFSQLAKYPLRKSRFLPFRCPNKPFEITIECPDVFSILYNFLSTISKESTVDLRETLYKEMILNIQLHCNKNSEKQMRLLCMKKTFIEYRKALDTFYSCHQFNHCHPKTKNNILLLYLKKSLYKHYLEELDGFLHFIEKQLLITKKEEEKAIGENIEDFKQTQEETLFYCSPDFLINNKIVMKEKFLAFSYITEIAWYYIFPLLDKSILYHKSLTEVEIVLERDPLQCIGELNDCKLRILLEIEKLSLEITREEVLSCI